VKGIQNAGKRDVNYAHWHVLTSEGGPINNNLHNRPSAFNPMVGTIGFISMQASISGVIENFKVIGFGGGHARQLHLITVTASAS